MEFLYIGMSVIGLIAVMSYVTSIRALGKLEDIDVELEMTAEIENELLTRSDTHRVLQKIMWDKLNDHEDLLTHHDNEFALIEDGERSLDEYGIESLCPDCGGDLDEVKFGNEEPFYECRECEFSSEV